MASPELPRGGDVNKGTTFIILVAVLAPISIITTALRVGVRIANRQQGWDDFTIAFATILVLIQFVFNGLQYHAGIGRHSVYLSPDHAKDALKWSYVTMILFFIIVCLTKISICLFILRIRKTGWLKRVLYALMTGLVITTLAPEIILFIQCQPIRSFWDGSVGNCWRQIVYDNVVWAQAGMAHCASSHMCEIDFAASICNILGLDLLLPPSCGAVEHQDRRSPQDRSLWAHEPGLDVALPLSYRSSSELT